MCRFDVLTRGLFNPLMQSGAEGLILSLTRAVAVRLVALETAWQEV